MELSSNAITILMIFASIPAYIGIGYGAFIKMEKIWGPYPDYKGKTDQSDYHFACVAITIFFPFLLIGTLAYKLTCLLFDTGPAIIGVVAYILPFLAFSAKDNNV